MIMTAATWESQIMTLKDKMIVRCTVKLVIRKRETRFAVLLSREVILVEPDILKDYDTATTGQSICDLS